MTARPIKRLRRTAHASVRKSFPTMQVDLYAYAADGVIRLNDFLAGAFVASASYSNQTRLMFDVTEVVSQLLSAGASRIGFNLRAPDAFSLTNVVAPSVSFNALEQDQYFPLHGPPATLLINDADGDGVEDRFHVSRRRVFLLRVSVDAADKSGA